MEATTVDEAVSSLKELYAEGTEHYTQWKRKRTLGNHYCRKSSESGIRRDVITCALSISLELARNQIEETYDIATVLIGTDFSTGDTPCRDMLSNQLFNLSSRVSHLRRVSSDSSLTGILNISDIIQTSESVRIASVQALGALYHRLAAGRPDIPEHLPISKPRSRHTRPISQYSSSSSTNNHSIISQDEDDDDEDEEEEEDDDMSMTMTISTDQAPFQSEPPSPPPTPPTPKAIASDAVSIFAPSEADTTSTTASAFLRPKVSVFSMFCPEAMTLQVDLSKPIPDAPKRCKCGYRWNPLLPGNKDYIVLKDGFRMSSRFLAKSHSDRNMFACCLCVPTGTTDNYESADALRAHINLYHRKWQILHDRDIH
ncbi:hypothetical protein CPAR01_16668 [Colletotrichum paranaense]|nr:uncharacterized protein CPAR01_16668 [Colletotrichum paranaense]XP_060395581.1 uncharacterized protein CABS01_12840 [Colletotrichum abscissum]KAI3550720.1 hypothetical protein CABS02_07519 [Colletotrichum abscissum]KAK1487965.1 hypothetical protein CABS01_12840 [Colletotrichum abscissum]KAK1515547.1 hypothetical protein CPAR01_16668 [Colletotrichum paranaense]